MEQNDDSAKRDVSGEDFRRLEIVSDLGVKFVQTILTFTLQQVSLLQSRLQLVRQAASPTLVRNISTHATKMDFAGFPPAKLGNIKGLPHYLSAWIERRRLRRDIRAYGMPIVDVHIATYARDADPAREISNLMESGYRMASLFELLCFIYGNSSLLGNDDEFITLKVRWKGRGVKRRAVKTAHCISRSPKGVLVYKTHGFESMLNRRAHDDDPTLLHFVVMDAKSSTCSDTDKQPPSES